METRTALIGGGAAATGIGVITTGTALARGLHMVEHAPPPQVITTPLPGGSATTVIKEASKSLQLRAGAKPFVYAGLAMAAAGVAALVVGSRS